MQALIKSACPQQIRGSKLGFEALAIATQNRAIAKGRWEAKKQNIRHGIPLSKEPFPPLIEHPQLYEILIETLEFQ